MKKYFWLFAAVGLLAVLPATPGYAWQGRMAGMGDVYGLVEDESDFLTHPAGIAAGKGVNFYFNVGATYNNTTKLDFNLTEANPSYSYNYSFTGDGDEWNTNGLIGIAFPIGVGRAGIFFDYAGNPFRRGKYTGDGTETYASAGSTPYPPDLTSFDLKNDYDNYAIRFLYGFPVAPDFRLGAELQIAYKDETFSSTFAEYFYSNGMYRNYGTYQNDFFDVAYDNEYNYMPYGIPYDSQYYEAQVKLSAEGMIGPIKTSFTVKAGRPFGGTNKYDYFDTSPDSLRMEGDVEGWNAGIDFWARYPLANNLVIPVIISAGHKQIERDGSGAATWGYAGMPEFYDYEHNTKTNYVSIGSGLDYTPCKGARIAGGLFYDYTRLRQQMYVNGTGTFRGTPVNDVYDLSDYPDTTEHRLTLKLAAEREFSPVFALRGGFSLFYGWVYNDYSNFNSVNNGPFPELSSFELKENGSRIGIGASIGLTVKAGSFSFEPFLNGGYQHLKVDGDGSDMYYWGSHVTDSETQKTNWFVGLGFSLRF